ncbi:vitamin K epoxide reductase family protein [Kribbella sp. NPDC048928]|uniref:vitamin K epoxide reductase family protein n=1 Tax=Kribbella sp. NPDC048928 TaxID=3364111 RepID=UPI00371F591A
MTDNSSARHRIPVIVLSLVGFAIATVLTLFQVGVLDSIWDPVFGDGSRQVLTSSVSEALPIPDASLGAVAYLLEAILESLGGTNRWRDNPWIAAAAGLIAAGLGLAALGLIALQALVVGAFCTLCLCSAAISLIIAYLVAPEALAAARTLKQDANTINNPSPGRHTRPRKPADPSQQ